MHYDDFIKLTKESEPSDALSGIHLELIAQLMGHSITRITEMYARYLTDDNLLDHI